ncbi:MAG: ATP-binding protein [Oscillospiraceae bacterium]
MEYELPEHPVYVNTDKGRMEQVLNNLIVNAKRNNRPGGILRLSLLEKDGLLNFSIFNQRAAYPGREACQRLWSKFYRDKNSKYSGSGLGLAIVAQVLSMQHLHYGAENQPGGVAFYFSTPRSKITSSYSLIGSGFQMEIRAFSSSVRFHTNFTATSHRLQRIFVPLSQEEGMALQIKEGSDYVFRYGMVLVAFDCCGAGDLHPVQGKVCEMVEQTGTGEEKEPDRKMG